MKKYQKEIIGIYFFFISLFILLSLFSYDIISLNNIMGPVGLFIANKLMFYLGIGSYVLPIIIGMYGYFYFTGKKFKNTIKIIAYLVNLSIWSCMLLAFLANIFSLTIEGHYAGVIGIQLISMLINSIGYVSTVIILFMHILLISF